MKTVLITLFTIFLIACKSTKNDVPNFPAFTILLSDSITKLNTADIKEGNPIVLLYFSPDCEHCQKETESILRHMSALKQARFYFVTNDPFDRLKAFRGYYKLNDYPNITLGRDDQFFLLRYFKGASPPYLVLYDRQKKQRAAFHGDTPVDTIISFVNHL